MRLNSKQISEYTGGTVLVEAIDPSEIAHDITWDSRTVSSGDVYVALPGERVDGHVFVADALRAGARIVLVTDKPDAETLLLAQEMGAAVIEVPNTAAAIVDIARFWRKSLHGKVIAITGSSGKTTTKNLIRDVLKASFDVVATKGNQNNELGVPKTLLSANPETQVIIVEMGMRGTGQITELCEYVLPDMGLITNIGEGHIELLGSKENIACAKMELFEALPERTGRAFLNRSDAFASFIVVRTKLSERHITLNWYDGSGNTDVVHKDIVDIEINDGNGTEESFVVETWGAWAEDLVLDSQGRPQFVLHIGSEARPCLVPLRGVHNVHNACAAASVAASLGVDIDTIVDALGKTEPEVGRQEVLQARDDFTVINDTYNANPDSMRAALMVLSSYSAKGRHVAVLGDMGELGDFSQACHEGVGSFVAELSLDFLLCVGELSSYIAQAAKEGGMDSDKIRTVASIPDALTELESYILPGDVVLVKASRFMGLERIVGGLVN